MRNSKKIILILLATIFTQQLVMAQTEVAPLSPRLTQYMLHQPFVNPAAVGSYESFTGAMSYRNDWSGMEGTANTQGIDVTMPLSDVNYMGVGLIRDYIGAGYETQYSFNINYAFRLQFTDEDYLSLGLSAGGDYIVNDFSNLEGINLNDPAYSQIAESTFAPNMRLGAYYFRDKVYAGVAISNLFSTTITTNANNTKEYDTEYLDFNKVNYMIHAGVSIPISEYWDLNASSLARYATGSNLQVDINSMFMYDNIFGIGAMYRTTNELAIMANFRFLEKFRLGYAYETRLSDYDNSDMGTHEIMLIFQLPDPKGSAIVVPRF